MRTTLTTPRLTLVPLGREHLPLLVALDGDADVMTHLIGRARTETEARAQWEPVCQGLAADGHGLGFWVGLSRAAADGSDGAFVGWWCATPPLPIAGPPTSAELGWRLRRERWGDGLATEGAAAVVEHCFTTVGLDQLTAETMTVNVASRGVMRKLGMTHVRTEVREWDDPLPGAEAGEAVYALSRLDWARRRRDR